MSEEDFATTGPVADRVIDTLNQGARHMDAGTLARLYDSRRQALATLHAQHAGQGALLLRHHPALWGLGFVAILLIAAWLGLKPPVSQVPAADSSELDIQLLTGELPPQVFADWSLVTKENVDAVCLTDS